MTKYCRDKRAVVACAKEAILDFLGNSPLTITITRGKSGAYSVHIVTDTLSADIGKDVS